MPSNIPDNPVRDAADDELSRSRFASGVGDLILGAPTGASLRIGIYAGWGEGKTSVLRLIESKVRAEGHRSVWIAPWATSTRDELLDDLLFKVTAEFGIDVAPLLGARRKVDIAEQFRATAQTDTKGRLADLLVGSSVEGYLRRAVSAEADKVFKEVEKSLKTTKLVVFVDDVDRVRPEFVPQLLLTLREALDHPGFFYVLALAPEVVARGLGQVHVGWGGEKEFLEKIVELPLSLPKPSDDEWEAFLKIQAAKFPPSPLWNTELAPFLPRNPRKAKLFFRFASSLERLLSRFAEDEIDWQRLCMSLILILEFPEQARALSEDEEAMRDLEYGRITGSGDANDRGRARPFAKLAPESNAARFLELCEGIRAHGGFNPGAYPLKEMLTIHERPPILTWKEFDTLLEARQHSGFSAIRQWVEKEPNEVAQRTHALFEKLVQWRGNMLDAAAESELESTLQEHLSKANDGLRLIEECFHEGLAVSAKEWLACFAQAAHWAHFDTPSYYADVRKLERASLARSLDLLGSEESTRVLAQRRLFFESPTGRTIPPFTDLTRSLNERLETRAVYVVVSAFLEPNGMERFWGSSGESPLKWMLFDPESALHQTAKGREAVRDLSAQARAGDAVVQENCRTYLRMLAYGAFEGGGSFPSQKCMQLLKDEELVSALWNAAVVKPLNPRKIGTLLLEREKIIAAGVSDSAMPTPSWVRTPEPDLDHTENETRPAEHPMSE